MKMLWISLAIAGAAMPVGAQTPPVRGGAAMGRPDFAAMQRREGDDLALVLGLSVAQRPALDAFLGAMRPPMRAEGSPPGGPAPGASPPGFAQALAAMQAEATAHHAAEQARLDAGRRFYGQLDARQKLAFDAVMRLRHGPGGPGPGGRDHDEHGPPGPMPG